MKTYNFAAIDPKHTSTILYNIEAAVLKTDAVTQNTHIFEDYRYLTADDYTQEQKPASTKNGKGTMGHS